jgi:putative membrane protein
MGSLLIRWILNALALLAVAYLYPGVHVDGFLAAVVAALVLGLANAVLRPILVILTLPVTILTLGLFLFVINALLFWLVAEVVKGFSVDGFVAALIGSLLYSLLTLLTSWLVSGAKK